VTRPWGAARPFRRAACLVTWNCAHIANPRFVREIARANHEAGRFMPMIVTPEELLGLEEGATR